MNASCPTSPRVLGALLDVFRREGRATKRDFEAVLQVATVVWNAAVVPDREPLLCTAREMFRLGMPPPFSEMFLGIFDDLVVSRRTTYANDRRLVGQYEVQPGARGEMRVAVTYSMR